MQTEKLTLEELLIELDAADTQLSNEAARVIRQLKAELETAQYELSAALEQLFIDN